MSLGGNLVKHIVDSSLSSLQLLCCVKCILILCRSWLADFIISKILSLESGNEVQEKAWIVFCKHIQSWWTFNYQPLSGTSWAGLQEKGKWQCGVWAGPRTSSAWKDVDWLQHTALSRPGFLSCHRTEGLCACHPSFCPLSVTLCSLPSLPLAVSVLPIQPPHSSSVCFQPLIPLSLPHHSGSSSPALSPQLGPHQLLPNPVMWCDGALHMPPQR